MAPTEESSYPSMLSLGTQMVAVEALDCPYFDLYRFDRRSLKAGALRIWYLRRLRQQELKRSVVRPTTAMDSDGGVRNWRLSMPIISGAEACPY